MKEQIKPITPEEVIANYTLPDSVIQGVNEMIQETWDAKRAHIKQDALIKKILSIDKELTRKVLFEKNYLDIEDTYRKLGWAVEHYSPDRDENFESYFIFKKKK
jgi:hypothetical protein